MPIDTGFLNGIRAIAAFWVLSAHCMIWGGWYGLPLPNPKIAVDLFMVLSGFLMAYTMGERISPEIPNDPHPWLAFYVRRFFRIAPAYYFSLGLAVVLAPIFLGGYAQLQNLNPERWVGATQYDPMRIHFGAKNIAMHVSFLFGLVPQYVSSTGLPDWSIGLEMQFYAVFPIIFVACRKYGLFGTCLTLAVACYFLKAGYHVASNRGMIDVFPEPSLLIFKLDIFLAGLLVCEYATSTSNLNRVLSALLAVGISLMQIRYYGFRALSLSTFVLVMLLLFSRHSLLSRTRQIGNLIFNNSLTRFMSDTSYSVYLFHGFFLSIIGSQIATFCHERELPKAEGVGIIWFVVLVLTYCFSALVYRFIELRGIRLGKLLTFHMRRVDNAVT